MHNVSACLQGTTCEEMGSRLELVLDRIRIVDFSCPGSLTPSSLSDAKVDFVSTLKDIDTYRM